MRGMLKCTDASLKSRRPGQRQQFLFCSDTAKKSRFLASSSFSALVQTPKIQTTKAPYLPGREGEREGPMLEMKNRIIITFQTSKRGRKESTDGLVRSLSPTIPVPPVSVASKFVISGEKNISRSIWNCSIFLSMSRGQSGLHGCSLLG